MDVSISELPGSPHPTPARQWATFILITAITAIICLGLGAWAIAGTAAAGRRPLPYRALVQYQMAKLETMYASTLFVGDSSLGNAIDAGLWATLSGRGAANLALTGAYGYAGSQAMLKKALEHARPQTIVIMQTAEMPKRPPPDAAIIATVSGSWSGPAGLLQWWRLNMNFQELEASLLFLRQRGFTVFDQSGEANLAIVHDYIEQGTPRQISPNAKPYLADEIVPAQMQNLQELADLCSSLGIHCLYAHGPLADPICSKSGEYIEAVNRMIEADGLEIVEGTPVCIPPGEVGDSPDHVRPDLKGEYTRRYFDLIKGRLTD